MAGSFKVTVDCDIKGPLADGRADQALQDWARNTAAALGKEGVDRLRAWPMNKTGRARGGFENNLNVVQAGPVARIKGPMIRGVAWAPWLEGKSRRNQSTSFRGYHLFRDTRALLQQRAAEVGQAELDKVMGRIG
jgi:hypothetical protein